MIFVYLIRHGKTEGNMEKRYVGSTDEPLCSEGIREVCARRDRLGHLMGPFGGIDLAGKLFVSPMKRCRQTAEILFPRVPQEMVADFREMHFGEFEYKNYEELVADTRYQAFINSGGSLDFPNAEPQQQFRQRVQQAFVQCVRTMEASMAKQPREPLVFVVHGGTIMAIMEAYARPHRDYFDWQVGAVNGYRCQVGHDREGIFLEQVIKF